MSILDNRTLADLPRPADPSPILAAAVKLLPAPDRAIIDLISQPGSRQARIAQLLGISRSAVCRRLQRIRRRLTNPITLALLDSPTPPPPPFRDVGLAHFLLGRSLRRIARDQHLSPRQASQAVSFVRGWFRGHLSAARFASRLASQHDGSSQPSGHGFGLRRLDAAFAAGGMPPALQPHHDIAPRIIPQPPDHSFARKNGHTHHTPRSPYSISP